MLDLPEQLGPLRTMQAAATDQGSRKSASHPRLRYRLEPAARPIRVRTAGFHGTVGGANRARGVDVEWPTAGENQRTTTTGQLAWPTRCWLTDPSRMPRKPPCPRDPTTSRSASPDRSISTSAGFFPSATEVRTSTAGVLGTSLAVNCSRRANASFLGWLS